jgi:hypothetical protein
MIPAWRLWEKTSAKGNRYLIGRCDSALEFASYRRRKATAVGCEIRQLFQSYAGRRRGPILKSDRTPY